MGATPWMDRDGCSMRATLWLTVVEGGGVPPVGVVRGYSDLHGSRRPLAWPHVEARFLGGTAVCGSMSVSSIGKFRVRSNCRSEMEKDNKY